MELSEKENIQGVKPTIEQTEEDLDSFLLNFEETSGEGMPTPEKLAELARKAPEPSVMGNEQIEVLSHNLIVKKGREEGAGKGVFVNLKNISDTDLGKVVFESTFFDIKGNIIDTVEYTARDFEKDTTRSVRIETPKAGTVDIKSYDVKINNIVFTPVPVVTGDDRISILKHSFQNMQTPDAGLNDIKNQVNIAIRNISNDTVATAIFEADFYDSEGNILGTVRHKEFEIKPNTSRAFMIQPEGMKEDMAKSYNIKLIKTVTADVEKVQLRRNEFKKLSGGREEVSGLLKNISDEKTDAVLVVTYLDAKEEKIGVRALRVKDIEPNTVRNFSLIFTPPEGETVKTRTFDIGEMTNAEVADEADIEEIKTN